MGCASGSMTNIDEIIAAKDMVVFSSATCPYCSKAIAALKSAGYTPTVVNVNQAQRSALTQKCGSSSVPKVFVKQQFVGGCNDGGLGGTLPLLQNGKIQELMGA
mmetsp:Transcript_17122/g.39903  ORF Transcript_17122/g.39903 Transcript_17122/m.39903 type:complete len:104 (+) Transcript_17122:102-413(+)